MSDEQPDINSMATEAMPEVEGPEQGPPIPHLTRPLHRVSLVERVANHLDWLQFDLNQLQENQTGTAIRTYARLTSLQEQLGYTWKALVGVAALLLVNVLLLGWIGYLLGMIVGHVR